MTTTALVSIIISFIMIVPCVVLTCIEDHRGKLINKTVSKGLASIFTFIGCLILFEADEAWGIEHTLILSGVGISIIGDILLCGFAKGIAKDICNAIGMIAFVTVHELYISAFMIASTEISIFVAFAPLAGIILMLVLLVTKTIVPEKKYLNIGVCIYGALIFLTLGSTINSLFYGTFSRPYLAVIGTALFVASDVLLITLDYNEKVKKNRVFVFPLVLVLYYVGQIVIKASMIN